MHLLIKRSQCICQNFREIDMVLLCESIQPCRNRQVLANRLVSKFFSVCIHV